MMMDLQGPSSSAPTTTTTGIASPQGLLDPSTPTISANNNGVPPNASTPTPSTSSSQTTPPESVVTFVDTNKPWDMLQFHKRARDQEKYCDLVLHVHGRQFLAHRLILASNSAYFDSIFQSKVAQGEGGLTKRPRNTQYYSNKSNNNNNWNISRTVKMESLIIACTEPEVFQTFLNFFYTGSVTIDKQSVAELLRLANNFMVHKLKEFCAEFLERFIDAENCIQVKEVGERYNIPKLVKCATVFVQGNLEGVVNCEVLMDLTAKQVEGFVTDKAFKIPHDIAVKFMSRWICHDIPTRERDYRQMLTHIDWGTMEGEAVVAYIDQEPLFGSSERCFFYVLTSLAEKGIRIEKYDEIFNALKERFGQELQNPPALYSSENNNLLQMAFTSAMEGLQVPPNASGGWSGEEKENQNQQVQTSKPHPSSSPTKKAKVPLESYFLHRTTKKGSNAIRRIRRNNGNRRWVLLRLDKALGKRQPQEDTSYSSGDEEVDPACQTETDGNGYMCHMCPVTTKKISKLERHLAVVHAHDVTYRCSECGYTCKWHRDYFHHMKGHFEGPPYKCGVCDYSSTKVGGLISHRITHVELRPYSCTECEFKSRSKANLAVHMKQTHNNEKPYRCSICGRNFASKNSLDQHAVGHNTDKTYSCTVCPFSTKYLNHFTNHKKTHHLQQVGGGTGSTKKGKGKELYKCNDPQCKYTTSKKSQLESHMRSHAGVRPHVCSICGRRFLEKSHLVRHERIHFNERPFKCEECDYASTRRDKLKEHKTRHHGANASAKSPYKPRPSKGNTQKQGGEGGGSVKTEGGGGQQVVYAKKSTVTAAAGTSQPQVQIQPQPTHVQVQQQQQVQVQVSQATQQQQQEQISANELQFILPDGGLPGMTGSEGFAANLQASGLDLQGLAGTTGIVHLRAYHPPVSSSSSSSSVSATTVSSVPTIISAHDNLNLTSSSTLMTIMQPSSSSPSASTSRKPQIKSRLILVQGTKQGTGVGGAGDAVQTLASFPQGTQMTAQELHRTLGIKLEDLQAQGIIGIQNSPGGTTARALKLEDLTGVGMVATGQPGGGGMSQGRPTTTTMLLDASQLQQLTQSQGFERGIPITIASVQVPSSNTGVTGVGTSHQQVQIQVQQQQQPPPPQQGSSSNQQNQNNNGGQGGSGSNSSNNNQGGGDFGAGLNNLLY